MKIEPVGYLYHDAESAEKANPLLHSTLIVFASDRKPTCRNETPLYTEAQMRQLGEACAAACDSIAKGRNSVVGTRCADSVRRLIKDLLP